jgi:hypothetical protein
LGHVIVYQVSKNRNPLASAGLAFVAFARAERFGKVAFCHLLPFPRILAPRNKKEFHNQVVYEKSSAEFPEAFTMKFGGWTLQEEYNGWYRVHGEDRCVLIEITFTAQC